MHEKPFDPAPRSGPLVDRAPRQAVVFPLEFSSEYGERVQGTCENLSESGLLALFASPLEIWTEGEVNLHFGEGLLGVRARVARVMDARAGLAFLRADGQLTGKLRELMRAAERDGDTLPGTL